MKTSERRKLILDLLDQSEMVKTQELMKTFDTSESTIRRDLTVLAENGKIVRVHGGAIGVDLYNYGLTVEKRQIEYIEEKQKIAKTASAFVKDRELIFLDASTTVGEMIPFLAGKKIKAVTNSPIHAQRCYEYGIPVYVIGGELRQATDAVIGAVAKQQVSEFFFNRAFMGTNGINAEFGYSTPDPEEALMKRIVMRHAIKSYVLADESKFNRVAFTKVSDLEEALIITTTLADEDREKFSRQTTLVEVWVFVAIDKYNLKTLFRYAKVCFFVSILFIYKSIMYRY